MKNFVFNSPESLQEVDPLFRSRKSAFIAGGMTVIPDMKNAGFAPTQLVDLSKISELQKTKGISWLDDRVIIGAITTYSDIAGNPLVREKLGAFAAMTEDIGDPAVRVRATIGGAVAVNDPSSDYPCAILAMDGIVITDRRQVAAAEFFTGPFATALQEGEIVLSISLRIPSASAYQSFRAQALRLPICGVFVANFDDGVRVAVTGLSNNGVFRWQKLEQLFKGQSVTDTLPLPEVEDCIDTIHASADYRKHLASVLAKRALLKINNTD